ncbi:MAG: acetyl-CoA acetyltransferase [Chloroflexi bacterium]|nr:acetyl-CoA acetyltransferase [Chloroflexota bacterium]
MESLRNRVAIIGAGCTPFRDYYDKDAEDLLVEACFEALGDAGIGTGDVQAAWLGGSSEAGFLLGRSLKLNFVPVTEVNSWCATGGDAFRNAAFAVAAGIYDVVLAAGVTAHFDGQSLERGVFVGGTGGDQTFGQRVTFGSRNAASTFATFVTRYAHHYGLGYEATKRALGRIAIKNYRNGVRNPLAYMRKEIDLDTYMNAPMISWPLGLHDCCVMPHGAAAVVLTRAELAKQFRDDFVLLRGQGMSTGTMQGRIDTAYDWVHFPENVIAVGQAYEMAGIKEPLKELDFACLHDAFTVVELVAYEDFGFAPRGKGGEYAQAGVFDMEGDLPVSPNGGLKSFGHAGSTPAKLYEAYKQLQGKCGERQVKGASVALTHEQGGLPGMYVSLVNIFTARD